MSVWSLCLVGSFSKDVVGKKKWDKTSLEAAASSQPFERNPLEVWDHHRSHKYLGFPQLVSPHWESHPCLNSRPIPGKEDLSRGSWNAPRGFQGLERWEGGGS